MSGRGRPGRRRPRHRRRRRNAFSRFAIARIHKVQRHEVHDLQILGDIWLLIYIYSANPIRLRPTLRFDRYKLVVVGVLV